MKKQIKNLTSIHDYEGILGAAIGDLYGSYYEFQHGPKTPKEFIRLHRSSHITDDTVLTAAIAEYLKRKELGEEVELQKVMRDYVEAFPDAGYGSYFVENWIYGDDPKPYNSYGNGSAMRTSAVAYFAKSVEDCEELATQCAAVTHNHPEGIKGAVVVSVATYMALHGASRKEIEEYARKHYDLDLDYDVMADQLGHGEEICQVTVPQALWCFLHSDSFEDCLKLACHIRWDADTLAAIACTIAEAYYKEIPAHLIEDVTTRLPEKIGIALSGVPHNF